MFFPTLEVIHAVLEYTLALEPKEPFDEKFDQTFWIYSFVPLSFNKDRSIFIKHVDESRPANNQDKFENAPGYTKCSHPYHHPELRAITSHIHPFYVILNAGEKIAALEDTEFADLCSRESSALSINRIYNLWMKGYTGKRPSKQHRHDEDEADEDAMSSIDEVDILSSEDVCDDSEDLETPRNRASAVSDADDSDEESSEKQTEHQSLRSKGYDNDSGDENTTIPGIPPPLTLIATTSRKGNLGNFSDDLFAPSRSRSVVTAPAAFKLSGVADSNSRLMSRSRESNHESPLQSKSHAGSSRTFIGPSQGRSNITSDRRKAKPPGTLCVSSKQEHERLELASRPGVHSYKSYDLNQKMQQRNFTQLPLKKRPAVQHQSQSDVGVTPCPYIPKKIREQRSYRGEELASIHRQKTEENRRKERPRNAHYSISEPTPQQDTEDSTASPIQSASSEPNVEIPSAEPTPSGSSERSGIAAQLDLPKSEEHRWQSSAKPIVDSEAPLSEPAASGSPESSGIEQQVVQLDLRNSTPDPSTNQSRGAPPHLSIIIPGDKRVLGSPNSSPSQESPTKKMRPYSSPPLE
uniref:Uncharacterized protein n=1 Tax=Moniliophthora roreri TaxID=221103 RepID=A0A0W0G3B2_MONRR